MKCLLLLNQERPDGERCRLVWNRDCKEWAAWVSLHERIIDAADIHISPCMSKTRRIIKTPNQPENNLHHKDPTVAQS